MSIKRLGVAEAEAFRALRLRGLERSPESFNEDFATESAKPLAWYETIIAQQHVLGYFQGGELLGVVIVGAQAGCAKMAHRHYLWGVYVDETARGQGLARKLMQAALEASAAEAEMVRLGVNALNLPAKTLYQSLGFTAYGYDERALKVNGVYIDEILMMKYVRPACTA